MNPIVLKFLKEVGKVAVAGAVMAITGWLLKKGEDKLKNLHEASKKAATGDE